MARSAQTEFRPDYSRAPGDYLREVLDDRGIRIVDFATRCGRPTKTISEILSGDTTIMPETALQFERVLGDIPASLWLGLEAEYQLSQAKERDKRDLKSDIKWMKQFPMREMQQKKFLQEISDPIEQVETLLTFFGVSSSSAWSEYWDSRVTSARFKQTSNSKTIDSFAISAWLRKGDFEAAAVECKPYSEAGFRQALANVRPLTVEDWPAFKERLVSHFADAGVALVFVPSLSRTGLRGAAYWATKDKAVIIVSDRLKSDKAFWFALFHEAAHILLHSKKALFLDADKHDGGQEEKEADEAAANMLIAPAHLREFYGLYGRGGGYSEQTLRAFAKKIGIAPSLLLVRLQFEKVLPFQHALNAVFLKRIEFD